MDEQRTNVNFEDARGGNAEPTSGVTTSGNMARSARRRLIAAACSVALLVTVGIGTALGLHWYNSRPRPTVTWDDIPLPQLGVTASLKTKWRDYKLYYQLHISPLTPNTVERFDKAIRGMSAPVQVTVDFYDVGGFRVCSISPQSYEVTTEVDSSGKTDALLFNNIAYSCDLKQYSDASRWQFVWKSFPIPASAAPSDSRDSPAAKPESNAVPSPANDAITISGIPNSSVDFKSGETSL